MLASAHVILRRSCCRLWAGHETCTHFIKILVYPSVGIDFVVVELRRRRVIRVCKRPAIDAWFGICLEAEYFRSIEVAFVLSVFALIAFLLPRSPSVASSAGRSQAAAN
jgi:hypothetical protein